MLLMKFDNEGLGQFNKLCVKLIENREFRGDKPNMIVLYIFYV